MPRLGIHATGPFGARMLGGGTVFSLVARHATKAWLMLFDDPRADDPSREFELDATRDRVGDLWYCFVEGVGAGQRYAWRLEGPDDGLHRFDADHWLVDPYARGIDPRRVWGDTSVLQQGVWPTRGRFFPLSIVVDDAFEWEADCKPRRSWSETVVYEAHVRAMTAHPSSNVTHPGTYDGLIEKIPWLVELGVTAVEVMPIAWFNELEYFQAEGDTRAHLRNAWGYSPLALFAPQPLWAVDRHGDGGVAAFKRMVKAMHAAGLEVILDVVFNHTGEGGEDGPVSSLRGLDNELYYSRTRAGHLRNDSGCGNTINTNHPVVRQMLLDCLRYWACDCRVDGFRFDLASILSRRGDGRVLSRPPVVDAITDDPLLRDVKLIAEPWDAAGLYQVGSFPGATFAEWNDRYRDDVRRFWLGDAGFGAGLATRLTGSSDLYHARPRGPLTSINFVTSHDGMTVQDLVSYDTKHNEVNGEDNRDGHDPNYSTSHGVEGDTDDVQVNARRERHVRNLLATLLLSQGVPMIQAGDECGRTQGGNNNAYCQDNERLWLDWGRAERFADRRAFVRRLISARRTYPVLRHRRFYAADPEGTNPHAGWFDPAGQAPAWHDDPRALGLVLQGDPGEAAALILVNGCDHAVQWQVPPGEWDLVVSSDETLDAAAPQVTGSVRSDALSVSLLVGHQEDDA